MVGLQGTWSQFWDSDTRLVSPADQWHTASTQTMFDDVQSIMYLEKTQTKMSKCQ